MTGKNGICTLKNGTARTTPTDGTVWLKTGLFSGQTDVWSLYFTRLICSIYLFLDYLIMKVSQFCFCK